MRVLACLCLLVSQCRAGAEVEQTVLVANPIRRVVSLLQSMAKKVQAEGAKEAELHKKFSCYCQTNGGSLAQSIAETTATVPQVQSDIEAAEAQVKSLQQEVASHQEDRVAAKAAVQAASAQRDDEHAQFVKTSGEYNSYVTALASAIPAIETGMAGTFLQTTVGAHLRQALAADATMTDYDRDMVSSSLGGGALNSQGYVPKSGEIVGILKTIKTNFEKSLAEVTSQEEAAVKLHTHLVSAKTKQVKSLGASIERKTSQVGQLQVDVANMKNQLSDEEAALIQDQKFKADLDASCDAKGKEWDERQKIRAEELVAIHETIKVLNSDDALDIFKRTLPSPSLLQVETSKKATQRKAIDLLHGVRNSQPGLDFIAVALSGKKVDFSKVVKMIDDMVALLEREQVADDQKKAYCAEQIDATEDKAKELRQNVGDLQRSIAQAEDAIAVFVKEIKELGTSIAALDKSVEAATGQRKSDHADFVELMASDNQAKQLLQYAKNRLHKFYNKGLYKAPASEAAGAASFVQVRAHRRGRDAPEAAPETWGAYQKKGAETAGVLSLIDLLVRELDKEMTVAETDEKNGQAAYQELMADSAAKRAADLKVLSAKSKAKADAELDREASAESSRAESKELAATGGYEIQLHRECDWLVQNADLRKQARADEGEALKQAKAVLAGADFALLQGRSAHVVKRNLRGW